MCEKLKMFFNLLVGNPQDPEISHLFPDPLYSFKNFSFKKIIFFLHMQFKGRSTKARVMPATVTGSNNDQQCRKDSGRWNS